MKKKFAVTKRRTGVQTILPENREKKDIRVREKQARGSSAANDNEKKREEKGKNCGAKESSLNWDDKKEDLVRASD